jgi:murein L,D-transpeptidase YcbB/YkuD
MVAYRSAPRPERHSPCRGTGRVCAAGAMALALAAAAFPLSPLAAAAQGPVPIGAAAALPPAPQLPRLPQTRPPQISGDPQLQALLYGPGVVIIAGERLLHPGLVRQFYAEHGNEPFWGDHPEQVNALLGAVFRAEDQGLDPALFHAAVLSGRGPLLSPVARDVLTSDAILSYADALAEGAVPPEERPANETLHPQPIDVVAAVDQAIAAPDPARIIAALAPDTLEYEALRQAYIYYCRLAAETPAAQGDAPDAADDYPYGGSRSAADGADAAAYASQHNASQYNASQYDVPQYGAAAAPIDPWLAASRAHQLAVALERLRWLPRPLPPDRIVVNTATQRLSYFQDNQPVFTTRVIVGEPNWQTPEFHATIYDVLYNPPWNVPLDILRKEILPQLARDRFYLAQHHLRWIGPLQLQQVAGPYSALGRIKFEMSDPYAVYLHDTPDKYLFHLENRMKSHGCVRVEDPQELAALLLDESRGEIRRGIAAGRTHAQALLEPTDVYIVYHTVSLSPSGRIVFHADPYHRDAAIWQLLNHAGELPVAREDSPSARNG